MNSGRNLEKYRTLALGTLDPFEIFVRLQTASLNSFFFESSESIGTSADTTVIGVGPFEFLRETDGLPFFEALKNKLHELQSTESADNKFQNGGIFGCIGYDCIAEIEPRIRQSGYFRKPIQTPRAQLMVARQLIVFEHKTKTVHLISSNPTESGIDTTVLENIVAGKGGDHEHLAHRPSIELNNSRTIPLVGPEEFKNRVTVIKEHIRNGEIFQAVLAERFECRTSAQPIDIFRALRKTGPAPYSFYFNLDSGAIFGASPEALVKVSRDLVKTNPIAGTRPRGNTPYEDKNRERQLLRSPKEAAEHLMLVDLARNDLGRVAAPGSVKVTSFRKIHRFSNVMHLVSDVAATLAKGTKALDALKACFPAGTLSGAPKIRAMEILSELETIPRGYYGGAVVAFDSAGGLDSCIAIRTLEMRGEIAILRAGAGIVADSKAENEYAEIISKTKLLRTAIAVAEAAI